VRPDWPPIVRSGPLVDFVYRGYWVAANLFFRLLYLLRVRREGRLPARGGVLIVANHASHFDPPLIDAVTLRHVHFLARQTLTRSSFMMMVFKLCGVVPVDRDGSGRQAFDRAVDLLRAGRVVCLFPEGTRSPDGEVKDFKRGGELLARRAGVPLLPVGIAGAYAAWPKGRAFPRPGRIRVRFGPLLEPRQLRRGGVDLRGEVRRLKQLA
jgi:1-acyl-sn-glycerol-3-phosphate acyltransferase